MLAKLLMLLPALFSAVHQLAAPRPTDPTTPSAPPAPEAHPGYLVALGLIALGVYQYTQHDVTSALQSILGGLAAAGVLHGSQAAPPAPPSLPTSGTTPPAA